MAFSSGLEFALPFVDSAEAAALRVGGLGAIAPIATMYVGEGSGFLIVGNLPLEMQSKAVPETPPFIILPLNESALMERLAISLLVPCKTPPSVLQ